MTQIAGTVIQGTLGLAENWDVAQADLARQGGQKYPAEIEHAASLWVLISTEVVQKLCPSYDTFVPHLVLVSLWHSTKAPASLRKERDIKKTSGTEMMNEVRYDMD